MPAPIGRIDAQVAPRVQRSQNPSASSFKKELQSAVKRQNELRLSAHAQKRLQEVKPQWGPTDQARLAAVTDEMHKKGANRSLVFMDGIAFLVSVPNRTVITAIDSGRANSGIFTNIDSAIMVSQETGK